MNTTDVKKVAFYGRNQLQMSKSLSGSDINEQEFHPFFSFLSNYIRRYV